MNMRQFYIDCENIIILQDYDKTVHKFKKILKNSNIENMREVSKHWFKL